MTIDDFPYTIRLDKRLEDVFALRDYEILADMGEIEKSTNTNIQERLQEYREKLDVLLKSRDNG